MIVGAAGLGLLIGAAAGAVTPRALADTRLGVELEETLARLAARVRSTDLDWVVVAVRVQREVAATSPRC